MELATNQRLSRWSTDPFLDEEGNPKVAQIRDSDRAIFNLFTRYHHATTDFIAAFRKTNPKALQVRLSLLARDPNNYLIRPREQLKAWSQPNYRPQVFALADKGITELKRKGLWHENPRFGDKKLLAHSVKINATIQSLELYAPKMIWREQIPGAGTRIPVAVSGLTENGTFVSDKFDYQGDAHGPFGIAYLDGTARFFNLEAEENGEVERNTLEQTSFFKKALALQHIAREKLYRRWGLPHLLTLVVCKDQYEIDRRKACIMRLTDGKGISHLLFRIVPAMEDPDLAPKPDPELFEGPWQRAGYPDFHINQP